MQFTEVLTRDEKRHLSRFVTSFEQEYALSDEFQVVSLARTLELGGFTAFHHEPEKKKEESSKPPPPQTGALSGIGRALGLGRRERNSFDEQIVYINSVLYEQATWAPSEAALLTDWNVPKLALAPVRSAAVTLASEHGVYTLKAGDWSMAFKPSWHTAFPSRGMAGLNLYRSGYQSQLPPLPREAQAAVKDFGADKSLVLWEADWEQREQYLDPAILVPVWRDLYSVVYTWDLTDAERAALRKASGN